MLFSAALRPWSFRFRRLTGQRVKQAVPLVAVVVPAAQGLDARQRCGGHPFAQGRVVGHLLQAEGEAGEVAFRGR